MKRFLTHLAALLIGIGIASGIHVFREFGRGMASWGKPQICTDQEVRKRIEAVGLKIPPNARDLYFNASGLPDVLIYVGMTVGTNDWLAVRTVTGLGEDVFSATMSKEVPVSAPKGKAYAVSSELDGPESLGPGFVTDLWKPRRMRAPRFHREATEDKPGSLRGRDIIFDPATGRLLIREWST
jgi:hypothetical protein